MQVAKGLQPLPLPVFAVDTETVALNVKSKSKSTPVLWGQVSVVVAVVVMMRASMQEHASRVMRDLGSDDASVCWP